MLIKNSNFYAIALKCSAAYKGLSIIVLDKLIWANF